MKLALSLGLVAAAALFTLDARADVAPMCSQFDTVTSCMMADADKPCPDGGVCKGVFCGDTSGSQTLYKCVVCPTVLPDAAMTCKGPSDLGTACGTDGECGFVPSYCSGSKFSCLPKNGGMGGAGGGGGSSAAGAAGTAGAATAGAAGATSAGAAGAATAGAGGSSAGAGGSKAGAGGSSAPAAQAADDSGCSTAAPATTWKLGALGALALAFLVARRRR